MFGYLPDPPKKEGEAPDWSAEEVLGAEPLPEECNNDDLILSVFGQGSLNSCVAQAGIQLIRACHVAMGVEDPEPGSRFWGWYLARAQHHAEKENSGTYIRALFDALNKLGLPPESVWPYLDELLRGQPRWSLMPPTRAFQLAFDQRTPVEYRRIESVGDARIEAIQRANNGRRCVMFGTGVTRAFVRGDFEIADRPGDNEVIVGGHAMLIVGYNKRGPRGVNSWTENWNDEGFFQMTWDYMSWEGTQDLWIADHVPYFFKP